MKLWKLSIRTAVLIASLPSLAGAQVLRPLDPTKLADVTGKSVKPGDVQFKTLSQPMHDLPDSSLSKGDLKFQNVYSKDVESKSLQFFSVSTTVLPKVNFTAKRIAEKWSEESVKQLDHAKRQAPINKRQIKAFTPGGEEELKKQLKEPH